jgi:predicted membrane channel-forming protein YqfA (hemolysin III family)
MYAEMASPPMFLLVGVGCVLMAVAFWFGKNWLTTQVLTAGLVFLGAGVVVMFVQPKWIQPRWMRRR